MEFRFSIIKWNKSNPTAHCLSVVILQLYWLAPLQHSQKCSNEQPKDVSGHDSSHLFPFGFFLFFKRWILPTFGTMSLEKSIVETQVLRDEHRRRASSIRTARAAVIIDTDKLLGKSHSFSVSICYNRYVGMKSNDWEDVGNTSHCCQRLKFHWVREKL